VGSNYKWKHVSVCMYVCSCIKDEEQTAFFKGPSPYRAVNTFHLVYKNQSVCDGGGTVAVCSQTNTKHINTVWKERTIVEC
jgi:hypothetical protein